MNILKYIYLITYTNSNNPFENKVIVIQRPLDQPMWLQKKKLKKMI